MLVPDVTVVEVVPFDGASRVSTIQAEERRKEGRKGQNEIKCMWYLCSIIPLMDPSTASLLHIGHFLFCFSHASTQATWNVCLVGNNKDSNTA